MLNSFLSILDRLIALQERRIDKKNERFDAVIQPIFDEMSVLHGDYVNMFEKTKAVLPPGRSVFAKNYKKQIDNAKTILGELRVQYAPLREKLRILAPTLKEDKDLSDAEEAYLESIVEYFRAGYPGGPYGTASGGVIDYFNGFLRELEYWKPYRPDENPHRGSEMPDDHDINHSLSIAQSGEEAAERLNRRLDSIIEAQRNQWRIVCLAYSRLYAERFGFQEKSD